MTHDPARIPGLHHFRALAVALVALAVVTCSQGAARAAAADLLPDLVAPSPTAPRLAVEALPDGQDHLLLRFDGFIHNVGAGPLEIRGSNPVNRVMTVSGQRIYRSDSSWYDDQSRHPQIQFENADGHNHWHLRAAARFSLWTEDGGAQVATGAKVGFCLQDVEAVDSFAPARVYSSNATEYCKEGQPDAGQVYEGISSGWQDVYAAKLPFQWVDVSSTAPGRYRLGAQVDPDNFVLESNESDNGPTLATATATVPGYIPLPITGIESQPQAIGLGAQPYGNAGPAVFRIESAPRHGTLSAPAGAALPGDRVAYTPDGQGKADSFTFSVRDAASPYPLQAPVATVTIPANQRLRALAKLPLLRKVRFLRRGRLLIVRAVAQRTGTLLVRIKKGKRPLGSCRRLARAGHRFRCSVTLRKHSKPARARAVVSLLENGHATAVSSYRLPRRLHRR